MSVAWYWLVIFTMISFLPALTVAVLLFLRIEALRGDVNDARQKVSLTFTEYQQITQQYKSIQDKIADAQTNVHAVEVRAVQIEESFTALSNKWNSRERAERTAERRKRKEEEKAMENDTAVVPEIPGTEQQFIPFPDQSVPQQTKKRKFGDMPG